MKIKDFCGIIGIVFIVLFKMTDFIDGYIKEIFIQKPLLFNVIFCIFIFVSLILVLKSLYSYIPQNKIYKKTKVDKNFESYFKPTSPSACPSESEAKVYFIDGRRTFYVGKIDEELGASNTPENPQEPEEPSEPGTYAEDIGKLASGTDTVSCGTITDIPASIPKTVNIIYKVIQIFVPLVLIIFGMIDMAKAVMGSKEDEIKKGQQTFIKRLIIGAIIFFVIVVAKFSLPTGIVIL